MERAALCDLLEQLGPDASTVLAPWTPRDIAVHLYLHEHDAIARPGLVLPGPWSRVAARHHRRAMHQDFSQIVAAVRSGPRGVFRVRWLRQVPNLNEMFVHHEHVRRANGGARPARSTRRWIRRCGTTSRVEHGSSAVDCVVAGSNCGMPRPGNRSELIEEGIRSVVMGEPGELLLYIFGRQGFADVELDGPPSSLDRVRAAPLGL